MRSRIEKADVDFLCKVTMDLAFVAQRINRQLSKGGTPKAGTAALEGFRAIDFPRLQKLKEEMPFMQIAGLVDCYNEVCESEKNGWRTFVFKWAWKPEFYDVHNPVRSMSVAQWGVVRGETDHGASWMNGCTVPLSWRLAQRGQVRTLLDIGKTLNESYRFKAADDFQRVFFATIHKSLERRTFSKTALGSLVGVLKRNHEELFSGGQLDFDKYAEMVEGDLENDETSPIHHLLVQRVKIMFLRVATLLNDVMHYDSPDRFLEDVNRVCNGEGGFNPFVQYGFICRLAGVVRSNWKRFCDKNKVLQNAKLERYFHANHFDKVESKGIGEVLKDDFEILDENTFHPKKDFAAPIYIRDRFFEDHCTGDKLYVKSCGTCGDVFAPELFEFETIMPIIEREIAVGSYVRKGKYILPAFDDSLPIFCEGHGRMHFDMMHDQINFMRHYRETGKLPDVDLR